MAIRVALRHVTEYRYDRLIGLGPQEVQLRPAPHCRTPVRSYSLTIEPAGHFINWLQDPHGNFIARLVFPEKTPALRVTVDLLADMTVINPFDFFIEAAAEEFPFEYAPELAKDLAPFLECLPVGPLLADYLRTLDVSPRRTISFLVDLNQRLQRDIRYLIRMEPGVQTCERTLENRSGSCRDSAWLLVQILGISFNSPPIRSRWKALPARRTTSPICTPGRRSSSPAPAGSGSIPPPVCSPAKGISRSRPLPHPNQPRRSPAATNRATSSSARR
jgi:hypothetical protein